SPSASRRAPSTTRAPWRAKASAAARPIPELAPVTRAILPSSMPIASPSGSVEVWKCGTTGDPDSGTSTLPHSPIRFNSPRRRAGFERLAVHGHRVLDHVFALQLPAAGTLHPGVARGGPVVHLVGLAVLAGGEAGEAHGHVSGRFVALHGDRVHLDADGGVA